MDLLHAVEFDDHHALVHALLVGLRRHAAHDEAPARLLDRGAGELRVGRPLLLVVDRSVGDDKIALCHVLAPFSSVVRGSAWPPDRYASRGERSSSRWGR